MSAENAPSVCNCQKWGKRPKQIGLPESVGHRERAAELYHCPVQMGAGKQGREPQSPGTLVHVSLCSACSLTRTHPNFSGFLGHSQEIRAKQSCTGSSSPGQGAQQILIGSRRMSGPRSRSQVCCLPCKPCWAGKEHLNRAVGQIGKQKRRGGQLFPKDNPFMPKPWQTDCFPITG